MKTFEQFHAEYFEKRNDPEYNNSLAEDIYESYVFDMAAVKIAYVTLNEILSESTCPVCGSNDGDHIQDCDMYMTIATLREIVEG